MFNMKMWFTNIFTKKELVWIIIIIIIFEFIIALGIKGDFIIIDISHPLKFLVPPIIILTTIITKKIAANRFCIKIEHSLFKFERWGWYRRSYLKKPFPMGLVLPFGLAFFTLSFIKPLTFFQFDAENNLRKRLQRKRGNINDRRIEINESDLGFTAAWGFYSLIVVSIIGIILSFRELALYPLYYILWNMIPWQNLDGIKLFFGSPINWTLVGILTIVTLVMTLLFV